MDETQAPPEPSKQERLQALQAEAEQVRASFEQNFAQQCAELCKDGSELEELFYEDKLAFFTKILEFQNQEIKTQIGSKYEQAAQLEQEIAIDDRMGAIEQAHQQFAQEHPEVDSNALLQFFTTLPPEVQEQIEALPAEEIFPTLLAMQQGGEAGEAPEQGAQSPAGLPQQVGGVPSAVGVHEPELDLPTQRY